VTSAVDRLRRQPQTRLQSHIPPLGLVRLWLHPVKRTRAIRVIKFSHGIKSGIRFAKQA
jgi:hypothetical protein